MKLRTKILCILLACSLNAHASWLGANAKGCPLLEPGFLGRTVEVLETTGDMTKYRIHFRDPANAVVLAVVSKKSNRIVKLYMHDYFPGFFEAFAYASILCDGTAEMPTKATKGSFELKVVPGGVHEKETISISLEPSLASGNGKFGLIAELKE